MGIEYLAKHVEDWIFRIAELIGHAMKAPEKSFRKGLSLAELFDMFPDEASAEA